MGGGGRREIVDVVEVREDDHQRTVPQLPRNKLLIIIIKSDDYSDYVWLGFGDVLSADFSSILSWRKRACHVIGSTRRGHHLV